MNFDLQTTRTMEIPACGGFLMAERTIEQERLFEEGKKPAFFSTDEELLEKCRYYLENESSRKKIVEVRLKRCVDSGYSNRKRIEYIINQLLH